MEIKPSNLIATELFGVDPGKSNGGIAKFSDRIESWPMPEDFDRIREYWDYQKEICKRPLVILEKVDMWGSDTPEKRFGIKKMLDHYAELRSIIRTRDFPFIEVASISWQSYLKIRIGKEDKLIRKRRYKDIATELYPSQKVTLKTCDALLLVEFGRRKLQYEPLWIMQHVQNEKKAQTIF